MEVKDINGQVIQEGDRVAAAFRTGNIAELRVGTVLGFGERGNELTVRVRWDTTSIRGGLGAFGQGPKIDITGEIEAQLMRFVKLVPNV